MEGFLSLTAPFKSPLGTYSSETAPIISSCNVPFNMGFSTAAGRKKKLIVRN